METTENIRKQMKTILFSLIFLSLTCPGYAQEKGVYFQQIRNWIKVKSKAKSENKYIFIDVYATWCGPCKEMDNKVYPSQTLGNYMNDKFISVRVQMDQTKTDDEFVKAWYADAKQIIAVYKIEVLPTQLVLSPEGKMIIRNSGYLEKDQLLKMLRESLERKKPYYEKLEQFKKSKSSPLEMKELAILARSFEEKEIAQKVADRYINGYLLKLSEQELYTKDNLMFIASYFGNPNSKAFKFFMKQPGKINEVLGDYEAQNKIMDFIRDSYLPKEETWGIVKPDWDIVEKEITKKFGAIGQEAVLGRRMVYHWKMQDNWNDYAKYYRLYFQRALEHTSYHVNNFSWSIFEHIDDPKVLSFACDVVMKFAMEKWFANDFAAYDTYANLLYKMGKREEAIEWEERTVKLSNHSKIYVETLEKMKKNLQTWPDTVAKL